MNPFCPLLYPPCHSTPHITVPSMSLYPHVTVALRLPTGDSLSAWPASACVFRGFYPLPPPGGAAGFYPLLPREAQLALAAMSLYCPCHCILHVTVPFSLPGDSLSAWSASARLFRGFYPLLSREAQLALAVTMQSAGSACPRAPDARTRACPLSGEGSAGECRGGQGVTCPR